MNKEVAVYFQDKTFEFGYGTYHGTTNSKDDWSTISL